LYVLPSTSNSSSPSSFAFLTAAPKAFPSVSNSSVSPKRAAKNAVLFSSSNSATFDT
jgi:hypothetical protein